MSVIEHPNLFAALAAAQGEFPTLPKDATNPHFKSKFAPLDTIVEATAPILSKHGLSWSALPSYDDAGNPTLRYVLGHASGERLDGEMLLLVVKSDPQGQGAAITYARRYAESAALNIVADEDVDGEGIEGAAAKPRGKRKPAPAAGPATIPEAEVHALAAIYGVAGWKDATAQDPHATLRMQLAAVGASNEGDVKDCIRALTVQQGATVRSALEEARDIASGKIKP